MCGVPPPVRGGSLSKITEVCKLIERERWKRAAASTWDIIRDDEEGEGGGDASSASGAGPCGFSCRDASTEVISERSNATLETRHVGPISKTAQRPG